MRLAIVLVAILALGGCDRDAVADLNAGRPTTTAPYSGEPWIMGNPVNRPATETAEAANRGSAPPATPPTIPAALLGDWALVTFQAAGQAAEVISEGGPELGFREDGRFTVKGDCNGGEGTYTADGRGALALHNPLMTARGCPQLERELRYLATLQRVRGYLLEGDSLRLTFDQPDLQLVYRRANR